MEGSQILRFAFRGVREGAGLSLTVLLTVALGVGATTAIFTVDYAALLAPLHYPHPDRLVDVWSKIQGRRNFVSPGDLAEWRRSSTAFVQLETAAPDNVNVAGRERPEYLEGMEATAGYCAMLGCPFFLGRNFLPRVSGTGYTTPKLERFVGPDTHAENHITPQ